MIGFERSFGTGLVKIRMRTTGVAASNAAMSAYRRRVQVGFAIGTRHAMEHLLAKTLPHTPIDKGELRRSGKVETGRAGLRFFGRVVFTAPYAVFVHEDLSKYHAPPTYAKFLERTAAKEQAAMRAIIVRDATIAAMTVPGLR